MYSGYIAVAAAKGIADLTAAHGGRGWTYFEAALAPILGPYIARYKNYFDKVIRQEQAAEIKPLNVIVITDGADDDEEATEELLVEIAKKLGDMTAPRYKWASNLCK
jgi:hypothetical protein